MTCPSGKRYAFDDKRAVKRYLAKSRHLKRTGLHPYRCPLCDRWHFGHRVKGFYDRG